MTGDPSENTRFENSDFTEIKVNGRVVGRVETRPESTLSAEDEAAVALEVDQLVESMNNLLENHHEVKFEGDENISAGIVADRDLTVEVYSSEHGEWRAVTESDA